MSSDLSKRAGQQAAAGGHLSCLRQRRWRLHRQLLLALLQLEQGRLALLAGMIALQHCAAKQRGSSMWSSSEGRTLAPGGLQLEGQDTRLLALVADPVQHAPDDIANRQLCNSQQVKNSICICNDATES